MAPAIAARVSTSPPSAMARAIVSGYESGWLAKHAMAVGTERCASRLVPSSPLSQSTPGNPAPNPSPNAPNSFILVDLRNQVPAPPTVPALGISDFNFSSGMIGRDTFRGPGVWDFSGGLFKNFRITEGTTLQFRGEMFNIFNHPNLFVRSETADLSSNEFVQASRFGRRNVQLALKLIF